MKNTLVAIAVTAFAAVFGFGAAFAAVLLNLADFLEGVDDGLHGHIRRVVFPAQMSQQNLAPLRIFTDDPPQAFPAVQI